MRAGRADEVVGAALYFAYPSLQGTSSRYLTQLNHGLMANLAPGAWYLVPGAWHLVPGTMYQVPGTWCLVPWVDSNGRFRRHVDRFCLSVCWFYSICFLGFVNILYYVVIIS